MFISSVVANRTAIRRTVVLSMAGETSPMMNAASTSPNATSSDGDRHEAGHRGRPESERDGDGDNRKRADGDPECPFGEQ